MNKHIMRLICVAIIMGCPVTAFACSICVMAYFDYILPPFSLWLFFPVIWFVAACDPSSKHIPYTWGLPKRSVALLISFGAIIIGLASVLTFIPSLLIIPPFLLAINTANKSIRRQWDKKQRTRYTAVSSMGCIALICLLSFSLWTHHNRTRAEFIINWGGYSPGRSLVEQIKSDPSDLAEIRQIVSKANISTSAQLANALATNGDPKTDFPVFLDVLIKARESSMHEADIENALQILTGLELPNDSSIGDWQKAFNAKYNSDDKTVE